MDVLLLNIEAFIPIFLAIMSLVLFTAKTRWFSYAIVSLAIIAELLPLVINTTALTACIFCLIALLVRELMEAHRLEKQLLTNRHS